MTCAIWAGPRSRLGRGDALQVLGQLAGAGLGQARRPLGDEGGSGSAGLKPQRIAGVELAVEHHDHGQTELLGVLGEPLADQRALRIAQHRVAYLVLGEHLAGGRQILILIEVYAEHRHLTIATKLLLSASRSGISSMQGTQAALQNDSRSRVALHRSELDSGARRSRESWMAGGSARAPKGQRSRTSRVGRSRSTDQTRYLILEA